MAQIALDALAESKQGEMDGDGTRENRGKRQKRGQPAKAG